MRIQTNAMALNAHRNLSISSNNLAQSIEKLSSGFRINRAADDAAGMAIANKLRADGRAMTQASRNAAQAGALLQIADGALSTIGGILDRMKELAAQAASDNVSASQRTTLQSEFAQLRSEITRIVETTTYQGDVLLDGNYGASVSGTLQTAANITSVSIGGTAADTYNFQVLADDVLTVNNGAATGDTQTTVAITDGAQTVNVSVFNISFKTGGSFNADSDGDLTAQETVIVTAGTGGNFLVGASGQSSYSDDLISVTNLDATVSTLGIASSDLDNSRASAQSALADLDTAIEAVATAIRDLGASQSRIEFASQNISSMIENYAAAESVIRDADMAQEMVQFTKNQILQQAGTAMLAQANAAPQSILSLLAR
jgi:flagellin